MKKQRAPRPAASLTQNLHGHFNLSLPGFSPYASTMAYSLVEPSGPFLIHNQRTSGMRYLRVPAAVRLDGPNSPWLDVPPNSAILMPFGARYRMDVGKAKQRTDGRPSHMWMTMHWMEMSPLGQLVQNPYGFAVILDPKEILGQEFDAILALIRDVGDRTDAFWPAQHLCGRVTALASKAVRVSDGVYRIDEKASTGGPDPLVSRVMACLRRHISESITIAQIARELNASASTVAHRYRAVTGETPMLTLRRMRVEEAKGLMTQGAAIGDVALRLGFCDTHHFSRNFKRLEGVTPSAFMERMQPGKNRQLD